MVSARVTSDLRVSVFSFLFVAIKRCPIAAKIAGLIGILPCCVSTEGYEHLPDLWGLSLPPSSVFEKFCLVPIMYASRISLVGKKKKKKTCHRTAFWSRPMTRNSSLFLFGLTLLHHHQMKSYPHPKCIYKCLHVCNHGNFWLEEHGVISKGGNLLWDASANTTITGLSLPNLPKYRFFSIGFLSKI